MPIRATSLSPKQNESPETVTMPTSIAAMSSFSSSQKFGNVGTVVVCEISVFKGWSHWSIIVGKIVCIIPYGSLLLQEEKPIETPSDFQVFELGKHLLLNL